MMSTLMHPQVLCSAVELTINQALSLNIHGLDQLKALEQKTLTVQLAEVKFPLSFTINQQMVLVTTLTERSDCTIVTSIKALMALKSAQQEQQALSITELIKQEKLDLQGDLKIAQQFAAIAESLEIDWQSEMAKHIGDIPTYKLAQLGKFIGNKLNFASQQIQADASEWLVHEKRLVVASNQLTDFKESVTDISQKTEHLAQRINTLLSKFSKSSEQ
jgi:ubiquinone biosynthesis protein UbiJ